MAVNSAQLQDLNYVPNYNTLNTDLVNSVDSKITQQVQQGQQAIGEFDIIGQEINSKVGALPEQDRMKLQDTLRQKQGELDSYVDAYGTRGALQKAQRAAREFQTEAQPYLTASNTIQETKTAIDESKADPDLKTAARLILGDSLGETIFADSGDMKELSFTNVMDTVSNAKDISKETLNFIKSIEDRYEGGFNTDNLTSLNSDTFTTLVRKGVTQNEAQTIGVDYILSDPQMRSQLDLELRGRLASGQLGFLEHFQDEDGEVDLYSKRDIEYKNSKGETVKVPNISPMEYKAIEKVTGVKQIVSTRTTPETFSNINKALNGSGTTGTNIVTGTSYPMGAGKAEDGVEFGEFNSTATAELEGLKQQMLAVEQELGEYFEENTISNEDQIIVKEDGRLFIDPEHGNPNDTVLQDIVQRLNGYNEKAERLKNQVDSVYEGAQYSTIADVENAENYDFEVDRKTNTLKFKKPEEAEDFTLSNIYNFSEIGGQGFGLFARDNLSSNPQVQELQSQINYDQSLLETQLKRSGSGRNETFIENLEEGIREKKAQLEEQRTPPSDETIEELESTFSQLGRGQYQNKIINGKNVWGYKSQTGKLYLKTLSQNESRQSAIDISQDPQRLKERASKHINDRFTENLNMYSEQATRQANSENHVHRLNEKSEPVKALLNNLQDPMTLNIKSGAGQFYDINQEQLTKDFEFDYTTSPKVQGLIYNGPDESPALAMSVKDVDGKPHQVIYSSNEIGQFFEQNLTNSAIKANIVDDMTSRLASDLMVGSGTESTTFSPKYLSSIGLLTRPDGSTIDTDKGIRFEHTRKKEGKGTRHIYSFHHPIFGVIRARTPEVAFERLTQYLANSENSKE